MHAKRKIVLQADITLLSNVCKSKDFGIFLMAFQTIVICHHQQATSILSLCLQDCSKLCWENRPSKGKAGSAMGETSEVFEHGMCKKNQIQIIQHLHTSLALLPIWAQKMCFNSKNCNLFRNSFSSSRDVQHSLKCCKPEWSLGHVLAF